MKLLPDQRILLAAVLLWTSVSDVGVDAASVTTAASGPTTLTTSNASVATGNFTTAIGKGSASNTTTCPPGYICYDWSGPVGLDPRYMPDTVPSTVTTVLFVGGCIALAVIMSFVANLVHGRCTAEPKVAPPPDDDDEGGYDETVVKQTLLTRLGVMSWKADPVKPQDRFAKRAVLTWLRRVARIRQAPHEGGSPPPTESGGAVASAVPEPPSPSDDGQPAADPPHASRVVAVSSAAPLDGSAT